MGECSLCPRKCKVNREKNEKGFCGQTDRIKIARAALHYWEEPCISGTEGSGAIFFTGCQLKCVYCQNREIANDQVGTIITTEKLSNLMLKLQSEGANNINLVTPTHFSIQIKEALHIAKKNGLTIPIVYNTSSYENTNALKQLEGLIDIYLPDMKYIDTELARMFSHAVDYPLVAKNAIQEMVRQIGEPEYDEDGHMKRGVIVRHLVLPGHTKDSCEVLKYLYQTYKNKICISILNQFTPKYQSDYPELNRTVTKREYSKVIEYACNLGIENGFLQEGETQKESFIPDFEKQDFND